MPARHALIVIALGLLPAVTLAAEERSGEQLYTDFGCVLCHGASGHRGGAGGRPIAPTPHQLEAFRVLLRTPANNMPAYAPEALTDAQAERLHAFLRQIAPAPTVEELPLLENFRVGRQ